MINKINNKKSFIITFLLSFLVIILLTFYGDFKKTKEAIFAFNYWLVVPILLLSLFNYFIRILRWRYFLGTLGLTKVLSWKQTVLIFFAGLSMTVTPGKAGEVIKSFYLRRYTGKPISETIFIIIAERLTDGLAALVLMSGGLIVYKYGVTFFIFTIIFMLVFLFLLRQKTLFLRLILFFKSRKWFPKILIKVMEKLYESAYHLTDGKNLLIGLIYGIIAWGAQSLALFLVLLGLGINGNWGILILTSLFIFCFTGIIGFASMLPAGIGVSEGTSAGLLILLLHLEKNQAVGATLLMRGMTLWFGVSIGIICWYKLVKQNNNQI